MIANKVRRMTAPPTEPGRVTRPATPTSRTGRFVIGQRNILEPVGRFAEGGARGGSSAAATRTARPSQRAVPVSDRHNQDGGVEMTMTPAKLRKGCDKVGGVYPMARPFGKGHRSPEFPTPSPRRTAGAVEPRPAASWKNTCRAGKTRRAQTR